MGNGRLGAMVFGGIQGERIQFNEDTIWTGRPHDYAHSSAAEHFPVLRDLMLAMLEKEREERWDEARRLQTQAQELGLDHFMSEPIRQNAYQPCGELCLSFDHEAEPGSYLRWLDLDRAAAGVTYTADGVRHLRHVIASFPDQIIAVRHVASARGSLNFTARVTSPHSDHQTEAIDEDQVLLTGQVEPDGIRFASLLAVQTDGQMELSGSHLVIDKASEAVLILSVASSVRDFADISADPVGRCRSVVSATRSRGWPDLLSRHESDHQALFRRVHVDLGHSQMVDLPTVDRLSRADRTDDPQLAALYFQFGRYLLIASSRRGSQPANLQGIWNDRLDPPWGSKWTVNINTEMNYWPAEVTNLSECHEPLFDLLEEVAITGRRVATEHYGARGWVLHHNTDLWRGAAPINASDHGIWPSGGAWLCQHLWWHYQFTGDRQFLQDRAYPLLRGACLFWLDVLTEDAATGWLISPLSNSPEIGGLVPGPTMDHQIVRALFAATSEAADLLEVDADLRAELDAARARIAPNQVGR
ncbi:glycoside hydrolase N-terminal domain-containing protein, partial [Candidatus Latescibacterota bacterium]